MSRVTYLWLGFIMGTIWGLSLYHTLWGGGFDLVVKTNISPWVWWVVGGAFFLAYYGEIKRFIKWLAALTSLKKSV